MRHVVIDLGLEELPAPKQDDGSYQFNRISLSQSPVMAM